MLLHLLDVVVIVMVNVMVAAVVVLPGTINYSDSKLVCCKCSQQAALPVINRSQKAAFS